MKFKHPFTLTSRFTASTAAHSLSLGMLNCLGGVNRDLLVKSATCTASFAFVNLIYVTAP